MPPIEAAPTAPTLRETVESAVDTVTAQETPAPEPTAEPQASEAVSKAPAQETEEQKAGRTAGRARDEKGRLLPGKAEKPETPEPAAAQPAAPAAPKKPRPSSWKKELEPHWDALPPEVQDYTLERERQYATGVSTYKTEADRAKSVMGALAEFEPALQQANIPVDKWIQSMGMAHRTLAMGSPQDKLAMVQQILANNRIPAQLAVQDAQGQWQLMAQQPPAPQPQQPQFNPQDINTLVQKTIDERLAAKQVEDQWATFTSGVQEGKYPHFEEVKATMAGLLQAGLFQDYPSAYEAALRLPQHAALVQAEQPQPAALSEAERIAAEKAKVGRARSQAVSVRSSTPSTMTQAPQAKDLRGTISDAFDRATAGRV